MNREDVLKKKLKKIKAEKDLPLNINYYDLAIEMLKSIGSIDYELRDSLIYSIFAKLIAEKKLSYEEMKEILSLCLSEEHLFNGIGKVDDDSVFNRTFSVLIVDCIISINNELDEPFLNKADVLNTYESLIKYALNEKDFRGFVKGKGWAHSTAHTSDALYSLANNRGILDKELTKILEVIKKKVCVDTYTYINEEDERLVNTFMCIYSRKVLSNQEIKSWIHSFKNLEFKWAEEVEKAEHLRENVKLFFRSLYFRCKKNKVDKAVIKCVEEVLESLPAYY